MLRLPYMQVRTLEFYQKSLRALFKAPLHIFFFTFVVEWVSYDFRKKNFLQTDPEKKFLHLVLKIL